MRRPRHRVFDYPPRFYKPETDEKERRKRRLGFTRQRRTHLSKKRSSIIWLILIIALIYIILKLKGIG